MAVDPGTFVLSGERGGFGRARIDVAVRAHAVCRVGVGGHELVDRLFQRLGRDGLAPVEVGSVAGVAWLVGRGQPQLGGVLAHLVLREAGLAQRRAHAKLVDGAESRPAVLAVACVRAVEQDGAAVCTHVLEDGAEHHGLAVVAAVPGVGAQVLVAVPDVDGDDFLLGAEHLGDRH